MKIDRYAQAAQRQAIEWIELLDAEGLDDLHDCLQQLGEARLHAFQREHEGLLRECATASARRRGAILKQFPDRQDRLAAMTLAAWHCRLGLAWLEIAAQAAADTSVDVPDREMLRRCARAANDLLEGYPTYWPFDDGRDPLGESTPTAR